VKSKPSSLVPTSGSSFSALTTGPIQIPTSDWALIPLHEFGGPSWNTWFSQTLGDARSLLNDPAELTYPKTVLGECVKSLLNGDLYFPELKAIVGSLPDYYAGLTSAAPHVTCFTELRDSLVLWNTYTRNAQGYSIEFDPYALKRYTQNRYVLTPICYEPGEQAFLLGHHIDSWLRIVKDSFDQRSGKLQSLIDQTMPDLAARLGCVLPSLKSPAYQHEREWRLISYTTDLSGLRFRLSGCVPVPYTEVPFDQSPITRITIGPSVDQPERARLSLSLFLAQHDLKIPVVFSEISYRNPAGD
jgi:hypothetical protein